MQFYSSNACLDDRKFYTRTGHITSHKHYLTLKPVASFSNNSRLLLAQTLLPAE